VALVRYSVMIFFPGGNPAVGASIQISLDGGNQAPLIFTDAAGTIPAANPMIAGGMGVVSFYAAPSLYLAELAGTFFRVPVSAFHVGDVWPNLYVHTQAAVAAVWTVDHHFGVEPDVTIVVSGADAETQITHPTPEQTVITFNPPRSGTAYLRR